MWEIICRSPTTQHSHEISQKQDQGSKAPVEPVDHVIPLEHVEPVSLVDYTYDSEIDSEDLNFENTTTERKRKRFESENVYQEFPEIPKKPYIFQRIQQNLLHQNLSYDSDDHDEWGENSDNSDKENESTINTPKQLRPRINDYNYNDLDSTAAEEAEDKNLNEDTNSENDQTKPQNSTLASEETDVRIKC